jgi:hypothetical protein
LQTIEGTPKARQTGVAFSWVTFFWRCKRKRSLGASLKINKDAAKVTSCRAATGEVDWIFLNVT